jgi:hypothetical protein
VSLTAVIVLSVGKHQRLPGPRDNPFSRRRSAFFHLDSPLLLLYTATTLPWVLRAATRTIALREAKPKLFAAFASSRETRVFHSLLFPGIVDFQKDFAFKSAIYGERPLLPLPASAKPEL